MLCKWPFTLLHLQCRALKGQVIEVRSTTLNDLMAPLHIVLLILLGIIQGLWVGKVCFLPIYRNFACIQTQKSIRMMQKKVCEQCMTPKNQLVSYVDCHFVAILLRHSVHHHFLSHARSTLFGLARSSQGDFAPLSLC